MLGGVEGGIVGGVVGGVDGALMPASRAAAATASLAFLAKSRAASLSPRMALIVVPDVNIAAPPRGMDTEVHS